MKNFTILLCITILITCQNPQSTEDELPEGFKGQLETDFDYAIIKPDGTLWTWGGNWTGQLGHGTMDPSDTPKQITTLSGLISIDFSDRGAYAADNEGSIWFWGNRIIWAEGPGYDTTIVAPTRISDLPGTVQLIVMGPSIYLVKNDGTVWHLNWNHHTPTDYLTPEIVEGLDNIKYLSGMLCLGYDDSIYELPYYAEVGQDKGGIDGSTISSVRNVQNKNRLFTIIIKEDKSVWSWGRNGSGCLGNGTYDDNPIPTKIDTLADIISISANNSRCLALSEDGEVWFWGKIGKDIDHDIYIYQNTPVLLEGIDDVKMIHASQVGSLLFLKNDDSYWSYDVQTEELLELEL